MVYKRKESRPDPRAAGAARRGRGRGAGIGVLPHRRIAFPNSVVNVIFVRVSRLRRPRRRQSVDTPFIESAGGGHYVQSQY